MVEFLCGKLSIKSAHWAAAAITKNMQTVEAVRDKRQEHHLCSGWAGEQAEYKTTSV
jgi:hypothetical protein